MDVIVVGLGSMGASAAYHLAARGLSVVGLDRFDPPHDRGAHSGGTRIIRMAYMEGAQYVPLVQRAYERWRALEAKTGQTLLTVTGGSDAGAAGLGDGGGRARRRPGPLARPRAARRRRGPQAVPGLRALR